MLRASLREKSGLTQADNDNLLYRAAVSLCVCVSVSVCTPAFFRHDCLTATKFGTHMRIDLGIIRTKTI